MIHYLFYKIKTVVNIRLSDDNCLIVMEAHRYACIPLRGHFKEE